MFVILDCQKNVIGRRSGYLTHAAAQAQCNRQGYTIDVAIWRAFRKAQQANPEQKLLYSIVHIDALPGRIKPTIEQA